MDHNGVFGYRNALDLTICGSLRSGILPSYLERFSTASTICTRSGKSIVTLEVGLYPKAPKCFNLSSSASSLLYLFISSKHCFKGGKFCAQYSALEQQDLYSGCTIFYRNNWFLSRIVFLKEKMILLY